MDIIKEIANDRLVIMVTHNPELAEQYSTRIIRLLDGTVVSDSNPYSEEDEQAERNVKAEEDVANKLTSADVAEPQTAKPAKVKKKKARKAKPQQLQP